MKVSYNWLKKYIQTELSPEDLGKILTDTGLEVESIEKIEAIEGGLQGVVIGQVLTCEKHPDADKLNVTTVTTGTEELQIVCGAPNVAVGQKVIVVFSKHEGAVSLPVKPSEKWNPVLGHPISLTGETITLQLNADDVEIFILR